MERPRILVFVAMCLAVANVARAQPTPPAPAPAPAPAPTPVPAPAPAPVTELPDVLAEYEKAFQALVAGNFDEAIAGLTRVAQRARLATTRAAASELRRLATQQQARGHTAPPATKPGTVTAADREADRTAGRTTFITTTTMASIYAGAVLIDLLDQGDDFRASVALVTGVTAAGFLASFYGTRGKAITEGAADTYSLGVALGLGNALLLAVPVGLDDSEQFNSFALGGLIAGGVTGMYLGDRLQPTRAQAALIGTTSVLGIATVGLGLAIAQPKDISADSVLMLLTGGLDAGAAAGVYASQGLDWSLSRARLVGLGTFLGAFGGWAAGALLTGAKFEDGGRDARIWASTTLAGMWGGFALTWHLTRNMAPGKRFDLAGNERLVVPTMVAGHAPGLSLAGSF